MFYFKVPVARTSGSRPSGCETGYRSCSVPSAGANVARQVTEVTVSSLSHSSPYLLASRGLLLARPSLQRDAVGFQPCGAIPCFVASTKEGDYKEMQALPRELAAALLAPSPFQC